MIDLLQLAVSGVQTLQAYQPGKPESELRRELGLDKIIKLASNENPHGASPAATAALQVLLSNKKIYATLQNNYASALATLPIFQALLQKGVIVRPIANYGLPDHLRITIGTQEENQWLSDSLTAVLDER